MSTCTHYIEENAAELYNSYFYFCVSSNNVGEAAYSMRPNSFKIFVQDCEIPDETVIAKDCDQVFVECNIEVRRCRLTSG